MKYVPRLPAILLPLVLGACSTGAPPVQEVGPTFHPMATDIANDPRDGTMLLVSLENGTVVKQTISVAADVCFKLNSQSSTMCLTQGNPIIDPQTDAIIGFEMIEDRIDLIEENRGRTTIPQSL